MSDDATPKYRVLVEELAEKTALEQLKWEIGDHNGGIKAQLGEYTINVYQSSSQFEEADYTVLISDLWGAEIDSFTDSELSVNGLRPGTGSDSYYTLINTMFRSAHRQIKGADKALDSIISQLKEMMPF